MSDLRLELEPPLARIVLDCTKRRNAMSAAMWRDLARLCAEIETHAEVDAVIVEGAGEHFCSGADISEFDDVFADLSRARLYLGANETGLTALSLIDRPTLAKMRGAAVGGGLAVALACDLRFAAEDTHIAVPPAKLGLLYGPVETRLLVETIGPAAARDLLFSGRAIAPKEALRLGLINRLMPEVTLDREAERQARAWATLSGASIRGAKKAVRAALASDFGELRALVEAAAMSNDFREGRAAFSQKRSPLFSRGRQR